MKRIAVNAGDRFGKLTVVSELPIQQFPNGSKFRKFACVCDCGESVETSLGHLRRGHTASCGCSRGTHKQTSKKAPPVPEYRIWVQMKARCQNPNSQNYSRYGGRGIKVCDRWANSYEAFIADMGRRPSADYSIERIDNNKGYCPENCKWATRQEQQYNLRTNRLLTHNGKTQCVAAWAKEIGKTPSTLFHRIKKVGAENVLKLYLG